MERKSSYIKIAVSCIFALFGYIFPSKPDVMYRLLLAYVSWSWFWGLMLLYPEYIRKVQSERLSVLRAYSYFHWGGFYICLSMALGVLGGGIYQFIKELLILSGKNNKLSKEAPASKRELSEFADTYHKWPTEDLIKATVTEKDSYRPEAIELMLKELNERGDK